MKRWYVSCGATASARDYTTATFTGDDEVHRYAPLLGKRVRVSGGPMLASYIYAPDRLELEAASVAPLE